MGGAITWVCILSTLFSSTQRVSHSELLHTGGLRGQEHGVPIQNSQSLSEWLVGASSVVLVWE